MILCSDTRRRLESCKISLRELKLLDKSHLEDLDVLTSNEFCLSDFWTKLDSGAKILAQEVTKFCIAFMKPPFPNPDACHKLCSTLELSAQYLVSTFGELPIAYGSSLHTSVQKVTLMSVAAIGDLLEHILETETMAQRQLIITGYTWEYCEMIQSLPKDNKDAVLRLITDEVELVNDANEEFNMALENDDEAEAEWTASDMILLPSCQGLIKTAKACLKKTRETVTKKGDFSPGTPAAELDQAGAAVSPISAAVDDFITTLYPPADRPSINESSKSLSSCLVDLLDCIGSLHLSEAEDEEWIEFLKKAVKHNYDKIQIMTDQNRTG